MCVLMVCAYIAYVRARACTRSEVVYTSADSYDASIITRTTLVTHMVLRSPSRIDVAAMCWVREPRKAMLI